MFHVPEKYRITKGPLASGIAFGNNGAFFVPYHDKAGSVLLRVLASDQAGWEHVSVSLNNKCPTWRHMCHIKGMFWDEEDTVIQYHPPRGEYVNCHAYTLHLWRPIHWEIPRPPAWMVGPLPAQATIKEDGL